MPEARCDGGGAERSGTERSGNRHNTRFCSAASSKEADSPRFITRPQCCCHVPRMAPEGPAMSPECRLDVSTYISEREFSTRFGTEFFTITVGMAHEATEDLLCGAVQRRCDATALRLTTVVAQPTHPAPTKHSSTVYVSTFRTIPQSPPTRTRPSRHPILPSTNPGMPSSRSSIEAPRPRERS